MKSSKRKRIMRISVELGVEVRIKESTGVTCAFTFSRFRILPEWITMTYHEASLLKAQNKQCYCLPRFCLY
jgi:hypothetical protein